MPAIAGVNGIRKDFRVVGKPNLPGVLSWAQAIGIEKNGINYVIPDMLHAKLLRSSDANARKINLLILLTVSSAMIASAYAQMERGCRSNQPAMRRTQEILGFVGCENCDRS